MAFLSAHILVVVLLVAGIASNIAARIVIVCQFPIYVIAFIIGVSQSLLVEITAFLTGSSISDASPTSTISHKAKKAAKHVDIMLIIFILFCFSKFIVLSFIS